MTLARRLADYALGLRFEDLPQDVVHEAERALLDAIGCALAGADSDAAQIALKVLSGLGSGGSSTVIGSGVRLQRHYVALANGVALRFWDFNDCYGVPVGSALSGSHPSDAIPVILAAGEQEHIDGRQAIAAVVVAYEVSARFVEAVTQRPLDARGWNQDSRGSFITPLLAGRIMGLTPEQVENAVGICGCRDMILGIVDAHDEPYTMAKNLRFALSCHNGILAALLAKEGFTGPARVLEGSKGFIEVMAGGDFDTGKLLWSGGDPFRILKTWYKPYPAVGRCHGHIDATLRLVRENNLQPEEIEEVRIRASSRVVEHAGDAVKRMPHNKETADHSAPYLTAVAIVDRKLGPDQFSPQKYSDGRVAMLIDRVVLEPDPAMDKFVAAAAVEIKARDGRTYACRIDHPKGTAENPMSDQDLVDKFSDLASRRLDPARINRVVDMIWRLDSLRDVSDIMRLLVC